MIKARLTNLVWRNKMLLVMIMFMVAIMSFSSVSAWSSNSFNNSLTAENLSFSSNQNITRYLAVPSTVTSLFNARLNLTGINNYSNYFDNFTTAIDTNIWDYYAADCAISAGNVRCTNTGAESGFMFKQKQFENFTMKTRMNLSGVTPDVYIYVRSNSSDPGQSQMKRYLLMTETTSTTSDGHAIYLRNRNGDTWDLLGNTSSANYSGTWRLFEVIASGNNITYNRYTDAGVLEQSISILDNNITGAGYFGIGFGNTNKIVNIDWINITSLNSELINPSVKISDTLIWNYTGSFFNINNNRTSNFISTINSYLSSCTYIGGYCNVPFIFHSDNLGILQYSDLQFNNLGFTENSQTYNLSTTDSSTEYFILNFTYNSASFSSVTANLIYNGTTYVGSINPSGVNYLASAQVAIPAISTQTNYSFYWIIYLTDENGTSQFNSTVNTQTVDTSKIFRCTSVANTTAVNFNIFNENATTSPVSATFNANFEWSIGNSTIKKNQTFSLTSNTTFSFCILPNMTYTVSPIIKLSATGYFDRTYTLSSRVYSNITTNESLYMLSSIDGTNIIIEWKDKSLNPLVGYYVKIKRYYPELNNYIIVQEDKTDNFGVITASLIQNTVKYKFAFYDTNNSFVQETSDVYVACRSSICVLTFIKDQLATEFDRFKNITNYAWSLNYNNNTKVYLYTWNDNTGNSPHHRIYVEKISANGTIVICNSSSTDLVGSLACDISSYGDGSYAAQAYRYASPEIRIALLDIVVGDKSAVFGIEGLLWSFILLITLIAVGVWYPPIGIGLYCVGFLLLGVLGIVHTTIAVIIAELAIGVAFIWAFRG